MAARIGSVLQGADTPTRLRRQRWSCECSTGVGQLRGSSESTPALDSLVGMAFENQGAPSNSKRIGCKPHIADMLGVSPSSADISPVGWESMDFQRHSQGTTSPPGHKRHFSTRVVVLMFRAKLNAVQGAPESSWSQLDEFDLAEVFATSANIAEVLPSFAREGASGFLYRIERASPGKTGTTTLKERSKHGNCSF